MKGILYILLGITLLITPGISHADDDPTGKPVWEILAPVKTMTENGMPYVKTYFFNANPQNQTENQRTKLKETYDSVTMVRIGHVFMKTVPIYEGLSTTTWYWWPVQEHNKTYLLAYIHDGSNPTTAERSYYEFTFADGAKIRWEEPMESPYNFNNMFILLDGNMQARDKATGEEYTVEASEELRNKILTTPLQVVTKYNGYKADPSSTELQYEAALQYVFTKKESTQLLNTLQYMQQPSSEDSEYVQAK